MRVLGVERRLGDLRPRRPRRPPLQVRDPLALRRGAAEVGSVRVRLRAPAAHRVDRQRAARTSGTTTSGCDRAERPGLVVQPAARGVRGASRIVGARARATASRYLTYGELAERAHPLREGDGLHAHRAAAGDGASVFGIVGLPGHRVLRADQPLRHAGRVQGVRRRVPRGGHRRHPRLGARPFPEGRARSGVVRRHGALRARGSAAGGASRLGHADLQLRPQRGPQFPAVERAVLAARVPRRRAARRRGRVDVVSRLLAAAGAVGAEPVRRPREPRGHRLSCGSSTR